MRINTAVKAGSLLFFTDEDEQEKLIVIDEFPYMCKGNKAIPSIIQALWDESFKDDYKFL